MKAYTDLEQSKKLAEFLPLETADMHWEYDFTEHECVIKVMDKHFDDTCIPAWSLSALLEQIPSDIKTKDGCDYTLEIEKCDAEHLPCGLNYHDNWGRGEDIITHYYDNFIDSSYEMIVKLHELKLL